MKPLIKIRKKTLQDRDLCRILIEARSAMRSAARNKAIRDRKSAAEVSLEVGYADSLALEMSTRCMRVSQFATAMDVVKEYVDIEMIN